jgi:hypothetical protein
MSWVWEDMIRKHELEFFTFDFDINNKPLGFVTRVNKKDEEGVKRTYEGKVDWGRDKEGHVTPAKHNFAWKSKYDTFSEKIEVNDSAAKYEKEISPKEWNTGDQAAGFKFKGESKPGKQDFKWTTQFRFGLPRFQDNLGLYTNWTFTCGTSNPTASGSIIANLSKHYNVGLVGNFDVRGRKFKGVDIVATGQVTDECFAYAKYTQAKNEVKAGATHKDVAGLDTVGFLTNLKLADLKDKDLEIVGVKKLGDNTIKGKYLHKGDKQEFMIVLMHKFNKNFTAKFVDSIQPFNAYSSKSLDSYKFGFQLEFDF